MVDARDEENYKAKGALSNLAGLWDSCRQAKWKAALALAKAGLWAGILVGLEAILGYRQATQKGDEALMISSIPLTHLV